MMILALVLSGCASAPQPACPPAPCICSSPASSEGVGRAQRKRIDNDLERAQHKLEELRR